MTMSNIFQSAYRCNQGIARMWIPNNFTEMSVEDLDQLISCHEACKGLLLVSKKFYMWFHPAFKSLVKAIKSLKMLEKHPNIWKG